MDFANRTFFIDGGVKEFDYIEQVVRDYNITQYLIAHESHNRNGDFKPHFHFLVHTTHGNFTNIIKHFVEKYNLRNESGQNGGLRKYGQHKAGKPIHDLDKYATYLCKDGNIRSTYSAEQLQLWIDNSFKKSQANIILEKLIGFLQLEPLHPLVNKQTMYGDPYSNIAEIKENLTRRIITLIIENDFNVPLTRSYISKVVTTYIKRNYDTLSATHILYSLLT
jgi:hypothetical protein